MAMSLLGRRIFLRKQLFTQSIRNNGYIILVPEIGEDLPDRNPLLQSDGLPEFNNITIEQCMAAIATQTLNLEDGVKNVNTLLQEGNPDIFKAFQIFEEICAPLDLTWGLSKTLYMSNSSLMPTKSYLSIHNRARRARAVKFNSPIVYEHVKKELNKNDPKHTEEQNRVLQKFALEGKLNGLELSEDLKVQLKQILNKLQEEKIQFKQKLDVSTKQFSHLITDSTILKDFPEHILKFCSQNSTNYYQEPLKVTLEPKVYMPIMEYCTDRDTRWNIWQALVSRGSGYGNRELTTSLHLENLRFHRHDMANLLGFKTFADMSMQTKMAGNVANVQNMLNLLLERSKPAQDMELQNLYEFAVERGFKGSRIELWDLPFWRRKQELSLFSYKEESFKDYFPLNQVLKGLFELCENLFKIVIRQKNNVSTWHKDVKYFEIFEDHSAPIGGFYFDPFARSDEKIRIQQTTGWMVGVQNKSTLADAKPLAALIFNFAPPEHKKDSYLSFKEVQSLFHKFGLALQHLLTKTNYSEVSGLSNIEWDAVSVNGHVLTHWLYNKKVIESISCHSETKEPLPENMYECLVNVSKHLAGVDLSKELYLSALDLELHSSREYWLQIVKNLWSQYRSFPLDKLDSHPCAFTQIFTEEWSAAYYSHIWSRMIAADIHSAFYEVQDDSEKIKEVGKRFRNTFLAFGGSCHPSKTFRKFRGRDPAPNALLSSLGLKRPRTEKQ